MNINLIYVVPILALQSTNSFGVKKKILGQAAGFRSYGLEVNIVDSLVEPTPYPHWAQFEYPFLVKLFRLPFKRIYQFTDSMFYKRKSFQSVIENIASQGNAIVYLRHAFLSPQVIRFYARLRRLPNVSRVYLEVPTWPYDREPHSRFYERALRPLMKYYVDRVVTFGPFDSIFGIPAIQITNGISVQGIPLKTSRKQNSSIKIVVSASLNNWVGLDRLLYGMRRYLDCQSNPQNISVSVVGTGRKFERWRSLTRKLRLEKLVEFKGPLTGKELDSVFESADLALGNLANHRRGLHTNADLKNREYCARGIPFVISGGDAAFPSSFPFVCRITPDNSQLDIELVVLFIRRIREQHPDFHLQMRKYAETSLDWNVVLRPIVQDMQEFHNSPASQVTSTGCGAEVTEK